MMGKSFMLYIIFSLLSCMVYCQNTNTIPDSAIRYRVERKHYSDYFPFSYYQYLDIDNDSLCWLTPINRVNEFYKSCNFKYAFANDTIWIYFTKQSKSMRQPIYSIIKTDTLRAIEETEICNSITLRGDVFYVKDTLIKIGKQKFDCYVFYNYDIPSRGRAMYQQIYIAKKNNMLIKKISQWEGSKAYYKLTYHGVGYKKTIIYPWSKIVYKYNIHKKQRID